MSKNPRSKPGPTKQISGHILRLENKMWPQYFVHEPALEPGGATKLDLFPQSYWFKWSQK